MSSFRVHYSGACFESGDSRERTEKKVHDRVVSLGEVFEIEATPLRSDESSLTEKKYVVGFEGEITVQAESKEKAENQAYDRLAHLGQVTVVAFNEQEAQART